VTGFSQQIISDLLEEKYRQSDNSDFIKDDPVSVPHMFKEKEDIEIASFLTATLAWGRRDQIILNARKLVEWMDYSPFRFITNHTNRDLEAYRKFYYRTFNGVDCVFFLQSLQNMYNNFNGLQGAFTPSSSAEVVRSAILNFRQQFFSIPHAERTRKHVSDPAKNSSCKRINLFLRWMVRKDKKGVDFGLWDQINQSELICPLDIHVSRVARKLGLLSARQDNWKAAVELTEQLKKIDPADPVKYDYALFCLGIYDHL
jgi:uncharacterized protein (TIGR02757 family)